MVLIPGGSFTSNAGGAQDVCTFAMDRSEVTVAQYAECVERGGCSDVGVTPSAACNYGVAGRTNHPMNCVEYDLAAEFCTWMGRRLPTEWEWQWAARGRDAGRTYPWGSAAPTCERWVWNEANAVGQGGCGTGTTAAVGSRSPAGDARDGLQDLAGNVAEWTSSQYEAGSSRQTVKGGSWDSGNVDGARASYRDDVLPTERGPGQGFRCVLDGTPSP
jgi:formylglycine-generating enzyme required for sulfatase activity